MKEQSASKIGYLIGCILASLVVGVVFTALTWAGYTIIVKLFVFGLTMRQVFGIVCIFWTLIWFHISMKEDNKKNERLQM